MKTMKAAAGALVLSMTLLGAAQAAPVPGQGTWETTLQARDLTGDNVADAFYDTVLNITWLRHASVNGWAQWDQNFRWAAFYNIGGYGGWRLPSAAFNPEGSPCRSDQLGEHIGSHCTNTEMGHLLFTVLGNPGNSYGGPMTNTGNFQGLQSGHYWLNEEWAHSSWGYYFNTSNGEQNIEQEWITAYAMAVHDGDIGTPISPPPPATFTVGGAVSGLTGSVTLRNNAGDTLVSNTNGSFNFATPLPGGSAYAVTVFSQPAGQTCTVANGSGTIASANVANVAVTCVTNPLATFTVGGTVSGLTDSVTLRNNAADTLVRNTSGAFTFASALPSGSAYAVKVVNQPAGQTCTVANGSGTIASAKVTNVAVICSNNLPFPGSGPDLNQHGLTGSWYEAASSGQGVAVQIIPDQTPGIGLAFISWFTFDTVSGGAERQRWYTLQGPVVTGQPNAALTIYQNIGGNFNAPPATNPQPVGTATLSFDTCSSGNLSYAFTDGSGRTGTVPLTRLLPNVTCSVTTPHPTNADFTFSGSWYAGAATDGQGFTAEVAPNSGAFFLSWFTYAPNGANAGAAGQRWYTAQGAFRPGLRTVPVQIFETTGGIFDTPTPPGQNTVVVGTGTMTFQSCSAATFSYNFFGGASIGSSGTVALGRLGPVPPGCTQ